MSEYAAEPNEEEPLVGDGPPDVRTIFSDKWYARLKWVAQVVLPGLALFYIAIAPLWGLPKQEEVAGTIVALDLLLGTLLGISSQQYKNSDARFGGSIVVTPNAETGGSDLNVSLNPDAIAGKKEIVVKVDKPGGV